MAQRKQKIAVLAASVALAGVAACGTEAEVATNAEDAATFYDGKTVTLVVPYDPGGGFDTYARGLAPYLSDHLGAKVNVVNKPGGGGLIGANDVYQSKGDGLTVGLINFPGTVFAKLTDKSGVAVDPEKWTYLARVAAANPVIYAGEKAPYKDANSLLSASEQVTFGIGGVGSDAYYAIKLVSASLGFPVKIIAGYPGSSEADAALLAGEVQGSVNSIDSAMETIENSGAHPLLLIGAERSTQLPDVPTVVEVGDSSNQDALAALASVYDLERILVASPGVAEDRATFLADAVMKALSDPGFQADMEKAERSLNVLDRAETEKLAATVGASMSALEPLIK